MVCDYEAAWLELAELVASKTQHGREGLLASMAEVAARHRVPAGELSRLLRLYGVEVERVRSIEAESGRAEPGDFDGGLVSPADRELAGHHRTEVHDGGRIDGSGASNGRRRV